MRTFVATNYQESENVRYPAVLNEEWAYLPDNPTVSMPFLLF